MFAKGRRNSLIRSSSLFLPDELNISKLDVFIGGSQVGVLALSDEGTSLFEYSDDWISRGFSLNPFSLPLEKRVFIAKRHPLDGLFGVFDDSLPDGWGRLLVDRFLKEQGVDPHGINALTRLAIVGKSGMGALEYRPHFDLGVLSGELTFDELAKECAEILKDESVDDLDTIFLMGGSSGGARPKVLTTIEDEEWIVKFPSSIDPIDIGEQEYSLALTASQCGIEMPEVRLLPSKLCSGYFAIKRFDRKGRLPRIEKVHMASAGALLETSHRIPNLEYELLMRLTLRLTQEMDQVEAMFRRMVFNVLIGNRDDHSKNFSYLHSLESDGRWRLSPGYDLTANAGMNGEHATTVNGKGRNITAEDMLAVGIEAGLAKTKARNIIGEIKEVLASDISNDSSLI